MMGKIKKIFIVIILTIIPSVSLAYTETTTGGQLLADVFPSNPGAFSRVSINLISFEVDLLRSNIAWSINGEKQLEDIGQSSLEIMTAENGRKILVEIDVDSPDGKKIKKTISIIPAEVDLLWESKGYVPPFYKGKALIAPGGVIKLVAQPAFISESGSKINPSELVYSWEANEDTISSARGQNQYSTKINTSSVENIFSVDISNLDNSLRSTKIIRLRPTPPQIHLYQTKPLAGVIYQRILPESMVMTQPEITVRAVPYFLDTTDPIFIWSINNSPVLPTDNPAELVMRQPSGISGESLLSVIMFSNQANLRKDLRVSFGQSIPGF